MNNGQELLKEMQQAALAVGPVDWGATHEHDSQGHADHTKTSVEITAETFGQEGLVRMSGLYLTGTGTVLCHTGTSPNSATHARILTALWNQFVVDAIHAAKEKT